MLTPKLEISIDVNELIVIKFIAAIDSHFDYNFRL